MNTFEILLLLAGLAVSAAGISAFVQALSIRRRL